MMNAGFHHSNNLRGRYAKGARKNQNGFQRRLTQGTFQHRDVSAIQTGIEGNCFLGLTRTGAKLAKNLPKCLLDCHPSFHAEEAWGFGLFSSSDSCLHFGYPMGINPWHLPLEWKGTA